MLTSRPRRGFTLIEVAVVLVVLAILAAIAVPSFNAFMDSTDASAAQKEAAALVGNAASVSSIDGYRYDCAPTPDGDTVSFESALEQVDDEQGTGAVAPWVDFTNADGGGIGQVQVVGQRAVYDFTLDLCTGALALDGVSDLAALGGGPGAGDPGAGDPGAGDPGAGDPGLFALSVAYPDQTFNTLIPSDQLVPTVEASNPVGLSFTDEYGDLTTTGVTLAASEGTLTGPSVWNFQATKISGGSSFTCALTTKSVVRCWGAGTFGKRGVGSTSTGLADTNVTGLTNAIDVAAGINHACAVLADGSVKCWGSNVAGQLGNGTQTDSWTPVTVSNLSGAVDVAAGLNHSCAALVDGTVQCWGSQSSGRLGNDEPTGVSTTPEIVSEITSAVEVALGTDHSCALLSDGAVKCWGLGTKGRLGNGANLTELTPVSVTGISNAVSITAGSEHTCALLSGGSMKCWGANGSGQLGVGSTYTGSSTPQDVTGVSTATQIDAALSSRTCARLSTGTVECWGASVGTSPVAQAGISGATHMSAGDARCAVVASGGVKCWGTTNNTSYVLGISGSVADTSPVDVTYSGPQPGFPQDVTIKVTDADGNTATTNITLTVN